MLSSDARTVTAGALLQKARTALARGDEDSAKTAVDRGLRIAPAHLGLLRLQIDLCRRAGDLSAAADAARAYCFAIGSAPAHSPHGSRHGFSFRRKPARPPNDSILEGWSGGGVGWSRLIGKRTKRIKVAAPMGLSAGDEFLVEALVGRPVPPLPITFPDSPANVRIFEDFLPPEDHATLLRYCLGEDRSPPVPGEDRRFEAADVVEGEPDPSTETVPVRKAWVMACPAARMTDRVVDRVRGCAGDTAYFLGVGGRLDDPRAAFQPGKIEVQITAHGHGAFYKPHQDGTTDPSSPIHPRRLSFVYYLHAPTDNGAPPFGGGDLRLFDTTRSTGLFRSDRFTRVAPRDNRLVLFDSLLVHEVCPVDLPSNNPRHRRFTVNGWVHAYR